MRTTLDLPDETAPHPMPTRQAGMSYPIPIAREADGTTPPGLTNAQLHAILEEDALAQHKRFSGTGPGNE